MSEGKTTSRNGLLIDYEFCTGCHSCEVACMKELKLPLEQFGIKVLEDGPRKMPDGKWDWTYLPMPTTLCNLCEARTAAGKLPSCAQHCQALVISYGTVEELSNKMNKKRKMVLYTPV